MSEKEDITPRTSQRDGKQQLRVPLEEGYSPVRKGYTPIEKYGYTPGGSTGRRLPAGPTGGTGASGPPPAPAKQGSGGDGKKP